MKNYVLPLLLAGAYVLPANAQQADSHPLNEVMINENRLEIPFALQNRNITILDKAQIDRLPVQSVNELLSFVSGVDVRQRGPWGAQADISIDGGTFEQTTILVNGVKMNDPQTGHNSMNLPIPLKAIERIEVLRGSAARIYGINSLTGAINIVTVKPSESSIAVQLTAGSNFKENEEKPDKQYRSQGIEAMATLGNEDENHLIAGSIQSGSGHRYNTGFKNHKIFYQGNRYFSDRNRLSLMAGYVYNNFGANGFYAAPIDKESLEIIQTGMVSVSYRTELSDRLRIEPRLSYRYNYDDYRFYRHDLATARNQHYTHILNPEVNATLSTRLGDWGWGAEARLDKINSSNVGDHRRNNYGFYTEFRTDQLAGIQINAGAYLNYNSAFGWKIYPGLDLGYQLTGDLKLYVNSGMGQRIPSLTDLYYNTPSNIGNENLEAESSWYAEGGLKYNPGNLMLSSSYFYRKTDDFIDWVRASAQSPWQSQNFLENTVQGWNIHADYRILEQRPVSLIAGLSYTYLDSKMDKNDEMLSKYALESLRHQVVAKAILGFDNFHFSITERFQERLNYKNYFLTDIRLAYQHRQIGIFVDGNNIGDTRYTEAASAPMPGRWFNLGINFGM